MKQIQKRLTYANVMSSIAVFLVIGGGAAFAALGKNSVGPKQLKKNAVRTAKIKGGAVTAAKLHKNAVKTGKIRNGSVTTPKLANGAVDASKLANGAVDAAKIPDGSLSSAKLSDVEVKGLVRVAASSGPDEASARAAATPVLLLTEGPLSVYGKCFTVTGGPTTYGEAYAATTEGGSLLVGNSDSLYGDPFLDPTTREDDRQIYTNSTSANNSNGWRTIFQMSAPSGASLAGVVAFYAKNGTLPGGDGVYGPGDACLFSGFATS